MTKPIIKFHNAETDEIIEREMTDSEFEKYKITTENYQIRKAEAEAKAAQKAALLERLGISEDEARLLLS